MNSIKQFQTIASQEKFAGWPLVGVPELGPKIPFFGQTLEYNLQTGNGLEKYVSIIRHFGWAVVFGVNTENKVITLVQWKPGVNCASWELPPGGIGKISPEASIEEITLRTKESFEKETGYGGGTIQHLGKITIESGKYRGAGPDDHGLFAHLFIATNLVKKSNARKPESNEIMETLEVPLEEFKEVLNSGFFLEASAVACAYKALNLLNSK